MLYFLYSLLYFSCFLILGHLSLGRKKDHADLRITIRIEISRMGFLGKLAIFFNNNLWTLYFIQLRIRDSNVGKISLALLFTGRIQKKKSLNPKRSRNLMYLQVKTLAYIGSKERTRNLNWGGLKLLYHFMTKQFSWTTHKVSFFQIGPGA